eukprot:gene371-7719_t
MALALGYFHHQGHPPKDVEDFLRRLQNYLTDCDLKHWLVGVGGDLNRDPVRGRSGLDLGFAGLAHARGWSNIFLPVGNTFLSYGVNPRHAAIDGLYILGRSAMSSIRTCRASERVSDHHLLEVTLWPGLLKPTPTTGSLGYNKADLRRLVADPNGRALIADHVERRRRRRHRAPPLVDVLPPALHRAPETALTRLLAIVNDISAALMETGHVRIPTPNSVPGRGLERFAWAKSTTHPFNSSLQALDTAYKLKKTMLGADRIVPTVAWTPSSTLIEGQDLTDAWAQRLTDRHAHYHGDWDGLCAFLRDIAPPLPTSLTNAARDNPTFSVFREAIRTKFNKYCANGPDMITNIHLILASDADLREVYTGLAHLARGDNLLPKAQLTSFVRLLFKAMNPHT